MARDTKLEVDSQEAALDAIYREHFEFVWCVLHRFGVAAADLDDATQDVFVVAHARLASFEGRAAVRTWLYSIAIRVASNRRRKHARRDALRVLLPRSVPDDLEELVARGQARAILESVLDRLDEPKRVVFVLAELEELAVPTIARIVGENLRTVYSRLRAARAKVAGELDRLHAATAIDDVIAAARRPPAIEPERAPRVWAGVLAGIAVEAHGPVAASTGLSLLGKLVIAGGLAAAAVAVVVIDQRADAAAVVAIDDRADPGPSTATASGQVEPAALAPMPALEPPAAPTGLAPTRPAQPLARPVAQPAPPSPQPVAATSTLAEEVAMLDHARALLTEGRAEAALVELDRHTARFADGALHSEAIKVRVRALCSAGRGREAIEHARAASLPTPQCS